MWECQMDATEIVGDNATARGDACPTKVHGSKGWTFHLNFFLHRRNEAGLSGIKRFYAGLERLMRSFQRLAVAGSLKGKRLVGSQSSSIWGGGSMGTVAGWGGALAAAWAAAR